MEPRERVQLHEWCVVPFRQTARGVEFCLVTPLAENRWEFPKVVVDPQGPSDSACAEAAAAAGLRGVCEDDKPLGQFVSARGTEERRVTGFLMQVVDVDDTYRLQEKSRRIWCLAEEGRLRIRRKPLRHFIDLALHAIDAKQEIVDKAHERQQDEP